MSTPEERRRELDEHNRRLRRWNCILFYDSARDRQLRREISASESSGVRVLDIDISVISGKDALLYAIERRLDWQGMFGYSPAPTNRSWDALLSGLCDLDTIYPDASGYIFVLRGARRWWREEPMTLGILVEVWLTAAGRYLDRSDRRFELVFVL